MYNNYSSNDIKANDLGLLILLKSKSGYYSYNNKVRIGAMSRTELVNFILNQIHNVGAKGNNRKTVNDSLDRLIKKGYITPVVYDDKTNVTIYYFEIADNNNAFFLISQMQLDKIINESAKDTPAKILKRIAAYGTVLKNIFIKKNVPTSNIFIKELSGIVGEARLSINQLTKNVEWLVNHDILCEDKLNGRKYYADKTQETALKIYCDKSDDIIDDITKRVDNTIDKNSSEDIIWDDIFRLYTSLYGEITKHGKKNLKNFANENNYSQDELYAGLELSQSKLDKIMFGKAEYTPDHKTNSLKYIIPDKVKEYRTHKAENEKVEKRATKEIKNTFKRGNYHPQGTINRVDREEM